MLFSSRHIGPRPGDIASMLKEVGSQSLDQLIKETVPSSIFRSNGLDLPAALSEEECLAALDERGQKNKVFRSYIGLGYYGTQTPAVILRNVLESPAWYTAYTPYQAEISQGRMEALLNFQTMVMELTGMPMANASLLDEGTAAAEAITLCANASPLKTANKFFVDQNIFPQTLDVIHTRAEAVGLEIVLGDVNQWTPSPEFYGCIIQNPGADGVAKDWTALIEKAHAQKNLCVVITDLMACCLIKPPGEMGADVVVGSSQRFGVPMGFGGPHAAFMSVREELKRLTPGRIIGVSVDSMGNKALRLALQTREQHIRREKATSNICTAQVLLAVMASFYAVYHGPEGLREIASDIHKKTLALRKALVQLGYVIKENAIFDTFRVSVTDANLAKLVQRAKEKEINFAVFAKEKQVGLSLDETTTWDDVDQLVEIFNTEGRKVTLEKNISASLGGIERKSAYLKEKVFNTFHSETEMLRYIYRLQNKDVTLANSMIPLGSCTMKLNATAEMIPVTKPEWSNIHPFAPAEQTQGYRQMILELEKWLSDITGFAAVSLQPNAGSQGEYAGLLVIRRYLQEQKQGHRNICLIPSSAHGTNPASAVMAGLKVVVTACDDQGNIDLGDLRTKIEQHKDHLACLMVTYPSTHGVFETEIKEICSMVHKAGGQVYMDGANMNALVGLSSPHHVGADVCHLNLHKTFCIPHGGGGPGIGPIGVASHLKEFLPGHVFAPECGGKKAIGAVSAAPWGSASILPISWVYIALMGSKGLKDATEVAILNANYVAKKLEQHYSIVYRGHHGRIAHECILDIRPFKESAGITVDDVAKRLMDFGFHSPTMSWPVIGTLMVEPTESESKEELDRFVEAMIQIREEIREIEKGTADRESNVLKNAPHPLTKLLKGEWKQAYTREKAAYPLSWVGTHKVWPSTARVDNVYGDKNLNCSCASIEEYL